jgi:hypothetical protein
LYSNNQIHIQMIQFEFKWINQQTTPHYRPSATVVGDSEDNTAWPNSNMGDTARFSQTVALPPARLANSARANGSASLGRTLPPPLEPG